MLEFIGVLIISIVVVSFIDAHRAYSSEYSAGSFFTNLKEQLIINCLTVIPIILVMVLVGFIIEFTVGF